MHHKNPTPANTCFERKVALSHETKHNATEKGFQWMIAVYIRWVNPTQRPTQEDPTGPTPFFKVEFRNKRYKNSNVM